MSCQTFLVVSATVAEDMAVSLETDQLKSQKDTLHLNCMVLQGFTMLDYGSLTLSLFHLPRCRCMLGYAVFCLFLGACRKRWKMAVASSWDLLRASVTARPSMREQLREDSGRPFRCMSHVAISSMLVNQLLYDVVRLSSFGFYGLSFVSKRLPQEALGVPEVAKWRSADCVPNTAHGTPRCLARHVWVKF